MPRRVDLSGQRFGRLVAVCYVPRVTGITKKYGWLCKCDCGEYKIIKSNALTSGAQVSCGCYNKERLLGSNINQTHGMSKSRLFITWRNMRVRCYSEKDKRYSAYGGRGITVCDEWRNSFEAFRDWALANGYRDDLTIDRIDVNGNYEPSNCRFITRAENNKNRRTRKETTL